MFNVDSVHHIIWQHKILAIDSYSNILHVVSVVIP